MFDTLLKPSSGNPEPPRRYEIFTGAGRRRIWTDEQKAEIVAEAYQPGATATDVARRHGLSVQQVCVWRRKARQREQVLGSPAFVPVVVGNEPAPPFSGSLPHPAIEIGLNGAVVRVPSGCDAQALDLVLRTIKGLA